MAVGTASTLGIVSLDGKTLGSFGFRGFCFASKAYRGVESITGGIAADMNFARRILLFVLAFLLSGKS